MVEAGREGERDIVERLRAEVDKCSAQMWDDMPDGVLRRRLKFYSTLYAEAATEIERLRSPSPAGDVLKALEEIRDKLTPPKGDGEIIEYAANLHRTLQEGAAIATAAIAAARAAGIGEE